MSEYRKRPLRVRLEFKLADVWIGVFWKRSPAWKHYPWDRIDVWLCLLPCVPLHFTWSVHPRLSGETDA